MALYLGRQGLIARLENNPTTRAAGAQLAGARGRHAAPVLQQSLVASIIPFRSKTHFAARLNASKHARHRFTC
jgi:hypothetical protein